MSCVGQEVIFTFLMIIFSPIVLGIIFKSFKVFFITSLLAVLWGIIVFSDLQYPESTIYFLAFLVPILGIFYGIKVNSDNH